MENTDKKALIVIRAGIRVARDNMETLLTDSGCFHEIQDHELRKMCYKLNNMAVQLTQKIEKPEPAEINLEYHVPGAVIKPKDISKRDLSDFSI